ncbi:MAG: class I SAM-dependent methyltransferase [Chloroflexi bacterium]|nr:class I SAM-dependent methyltransferase [Chloroflexota bacterium]
MSNSATDPGYLRYQYADADKLRLRHQTHALYSEQATSFLDWLMPTIDPQPGALVLDVGCGSGAYHPLLAKYNPRIVAIDASQGMLDVVQQQAQQQTLPVQSMRAFAEALPLRDAACDRVMGNHMLYHVADQLAALREMRRVLKPSGRVILATNAADSGQRLIDVHLEIARTAGYTPLDERFDRGFSLNHLDLVREVFPNAERRIYHDAFLFPTPEPALAYYASGVIDMIAERPADGSHRARLMPLFEKRVQEIIEREGVFRVPKSSGCFVAEI